MTPPRSTDLPAVVVEVAESLTDAIAAQTARLGRAVELDPVAVLRGRATDGSSGRPLGPRWEGWTRIVATRSGWIATSLVRSDDVALVPAWLCRWVDVDAATADPWAAIGVAARRTTAAELVEAAAGLGLPVARLGEYARTAADVDSEGDRRDGVLASRVEGTAPPVEALDRVRVVDLSALWAGPLCGAVLAAAGADVTKVELAGRPDALRDGPSAELFAQLDAGKRHVVIDHRTVTGRTQLLELVSSADVVIEGSRPRALQQLGIDAEAMLTADAGPRSWVSITGFGRADGDRVAFGDVAAVAGGLVSWDGGVPRRCGDAIADPLTGLAAAKSTLDHLAAGGRWLLDVSMAHVAALAARPCLAAPGAA